VERGILWGLPFEDSKVVRSGNGALVLWCLVRHRRVIYPVEYSKYLKWKHRFPLDSISFSYVLPHIFQGILDSRN
jgi:hypothetical protein